MIDRLIKHLPKLNWLLSISVLVVFLYCLKKIGIACHFEEWTGRGLYPGLALANGFDIYETTEGPLVTLYGVGMAVFYSVSNLASTPTLAIWLAYLANLTGILIPLYILLRNLFTNEKNTFSKDILSSLSLILITVTLLIERTTFGILQIHADTPALSFILIALCMFQVYESKKKKKLLFLTSILLVLAVWSKLPTLPVLIFPALYLLIDKRYTEALTYLALMIVTFIFITSSICIFYGLNDVLYYIIEFPSGSMWSYRNHLFDGTDAILKRHSYFEGIPLLFRYFVMYLQEYWYFIFSSVALFIVSFHITSNLKFLFRSVSILALLTLPTCLAHLARFGAVENALIFTNAFAIIGFILLLVNLLFENLRKGFAVLAVLLITTLSILPTLKLAKAISVSTRNSPHQQAFDYLQKGNKDIYFGWYPISHILHSGNNYTSIEVPTWVGMNQPDKINFNLSHFPERSKYLATSLTGYGNTMLEKYIGALEEVPTISELSNWRIFKIIAVKN